MKIVITGGTGFIGNAVCDFFAAQGYEICVITRGAERKDERGVRYVSVEKIDEETDGADVVINLAGENISRGRWTGEQMDGILHSRINAGLRITEALKKASKKPRLLIQASAAGFYGDRGDEYITENSGRGSGFLADVCGKWEESTAQVQEEGVRRCVIRLGVVLGKGGFLKKLEMPFKMFLGSRMGNGKQYVSWIYMDDLIKIISYCIKNDTAAGVYNACSPEPVTNSELSEKFAKTLKRPCLFAIPAFVLKIMFGKMAKEVILSGARVIPERLVKEGFVFEYPQLQKALEKIYLRRDL